MKREIFVGGLVLGLAAALEACGAEATADPPSMAPKAEQADRILVEKAARRLTLWRGETLLKTYAVALGTNPEGHKTREGDGRTPEGLYKISGRNPASAFHLSLRISYPNASDRAAAKAAGVSPGGDIMIHGQPNALKADKGKIAHDWTIGCVAVSDAEIEEIWSLVPNGAEIELKP